jgi:hypothetical protein
VEESRKDFGIILDEAEVLAVAFGNHSSCQYCGLYRTWEVENVDFLDAIAVLSVVACLSYEVGPELRLG